MKTSQTIESITDIAELEQMVRFLFLTLRRPLRRKLRMMWFFDVSKVKESNFPPQIFEAHLLENTN